MKKKISLIIPCYNEEEMIDILYDEINKVLVKLPKYDFIFLFVDDGSKDQTLSLIKAKAKKDHRVKYISFSRNFGKESSMLAGLEAAQKLDVDAALLMDADMQDPPSLMLEFFKYYEEGYKYIFTRNKTRKGQALLKRFFANAFYVIYAWLTGDKNRVHSARDFALLDRDVINAFLTYKDKHRYSKGISSQIGFKKKCIEYDFQERQAGTTKWSFRKLFKYAMTGIKQFSHVYILVPNLISIFLSIALILQIIFGHIYKYDYRYIYIAITAGVLLLNITLKYVMKLGYDIRDQLLNRPHYLTAETNIE